MIDRKNADNLSAAGGETKPGADEGSKSIAPSIAPVGGNFQISTALAQVTYLSFAAKQFLNAPHQYRLFTVELRVPKPGIENLELNGVRIGARRWLSVFSCS